MTKLEQIKTRIQDAGINVLAFEKASDETDAEIYLEKGYSVQVGRGYLCLSRELPDGTFSYVNDVNVNQIITIVQVS